MKAYIGKATDEGLDDEGGKYVAICNQHFTILNSQFKKYIVGIDTDEFCDCCRGNCADGYDCPSCGKVGA
jgi:hypothetical protein